MIDATPSSSGFRGVRAAHPLSRAEARGPALHPSEDLLLKIVSLHVIAMGWMIGGQVLWAQCIGFCTAALAFGIALRPRTHEADRSGAPSLRIAMWPRLLRFPLFWLGLALLGYLVLQACNPSWAFVTDGKLVWAMPIPAVEWLPTSTSMPFFNSLGLRGPWHMILIYATAWLTVCAVWVGFIHRRSVQTLLLVIALSGTALALLGIVQQFLSNGKILWFVASKNPSFFATFPYKNHAGNYLNLVVAVLCGLAFLYHQRAVRRFDKSSPAGVLAFLAACVGVAILISAARGAAVAMFLCLGGCVGAFIVRQLFMKEGTQKPIMLLSLAIFFGVFLKIGLGTLNSQEAWGRLRQGLFERDVSLDMRSVAREAAFEMLADTWPRGVGAANFQFQFTQYQQRHPLIAVDQFWEHAHCDLLEIPIEQGAVGTALIVGAVIWLGITLVRGAFWRKPIAVCIVLGAVLTVAQSLWDFPFYCASVIELWWLLLTLAAMWVRFEGGDSHKSRP